MRKFRKEKVLSFGKKLEVVVSVCGYYKDNNLDGHIITDTEPTIRFGIDEVRERKSKKVVKNGFMTAWLSERKESPRLFEKMNLPKEVEYISRIGDDIAALGRGDYDNICQAEKELIDEARKAMGLISVEEEEKQKEIKNAKAIIEMVEVDRVRVMPAAKIAEWQTRYNNLHNEGGDGYIPPVIAEEDYEKAKRIINNQ